MTASSYKPNTESTGLRLGTSDVCGARLAAGAGTLMGGRGNSPMSARRGRVLSRVMVSGGTGGGRGIGGKRPKSRSRFCTVHCELRYGSPGLDGPRGRRTASPSVSERAMWTGVGGVTAVPSIPSMRRPRAVFGLAVIVVSERVIGGCVGLRAGDARVASRTLADRDGAYCRRRLGVRDNDAARCTVASA